MNDLGEKCIVDGFGGFGELHASESSSQEGERGSGRKEMASKLRRSERPYARCAISSLDVRSDGVTFNVPRQWCTETSFITLCSLLPFDKRQLAS